MVGEEGGIIHHHPQLTSRKLFQIVQRVPNNIGYETVIFLNMVAIQNG